MDLVPERKPLIFRTFVLYMTTQTFKRLQTKNKEKSNQFSNISCVSFQIGLIRRIEKKKNNWKILSHLLMTFSDTLEWITHIKFKKKNNSQGSSNLISFCVVENVLAFITYLEYLNAIELKLRGDVKEEYRQYNVLFNYNYIQNLYLVCTETARCIKLTHNTRFQQHLSI